jgi:hypothetical protein
MLSVIVIVSLLQYSSLAVFQFYLNKEVHVPLGKCKIEPYRMFLRLSQDCS